VSCLGGGAPGFDHGIECLSGGVAGLTRGFGF